MDVSLGISVTQKGVKEAASGLDTLTTSAEKVERATGAAARATETMASGVAQTKGATASAAASATSLAQAEERVASSAGRASSSLVRLNATANDNSRALRGLAGQTGNIAAQFNDIGVQLAGGQSPFLIALQQGTQLNQIFGGQGLRSIIGGLAGAFASLANPVSIATIAIITLAGTAVQYFTELFSNGEKSEETLKRQADLIDRVAQTWGDAVPALQKYVDELERARDVAELQETVQVRTASVMDDVRAKFDEFSSSLVGVTDLLYRASLSPQAPLHELGVAFESLQEKVEAGKATAEDFQRVTDATDAATASGIKGLDKFRDAFASLAQGVLGTIGALKTFQSQAAGAIATKYPSPGSYANVDRSADGPIQNESFPLPEIGPRIGEKPSTESMYPGGTWNKGSTKAAAQDVYKSAILSAQERTKAIQAETAAQASLNPLVNDYSYAVTKAKSSADLLAAAEKQKLAITPELLSQIDKTSSALAAATEAQNRQTEAIQKAKQAMEFVKNTTLGFVNDLRDGLKNGEGFWKSFGKAALNVLDRITDKLLGDVMDAVFKVGSAGSGTGGGGILGFLGGLFGGGSSSGGFNLGSGATAYTGSLAGYATGTSSARPGIAWVGEKGPELVRFKGGEEVVPNHRLQVPANQNASGQNGNVNISIAPVFNAANADDAAIAALRSDFAKFRADVPATIVSTVKDAQKRRMI